MKAKRDFDIEFVNETKFIDNASLQQIREFRETKKELIDKIEVWLREDNIKEGRRKYLRGWRKLEVRLLAHSKKRMKQINVVLHNGITIDFARRFVREAAEALPQDQFQQIYGKCVIQGEDDNTTIETIRNFLIECQTKINVNVKQTESVV